MSATAQSRVSLEVVIDSPAGARLATGHGADRLELCAGLLEGGLTPGPGLLHQTLAVTPLPVMVMARPRGGDFLYDDDEFTALLADVRAAIAGGAAGIVAGALHPDGTIDRDRTARIREACGDAAFTFHRAFDLTPDPLAALDTLIALGVGRVLTSGQQPTALAGAPLLQQLVARAGDRIVVMAGGGVRPDHVRTLVQTTGVREVHLSATAWAAGGMTFQRPAVAMGIALPPAGREQRRTDGTIVAAMRAALDR